MKVAEIKVSYLPNKIDKIKICESSQLYQLALSHWNLKTIEMQEEVKVVFLNRANEVLGIYELAKGGLSSSYVDIKLLLSIALKSLAFCIVLIHNHPSGNLKPSKADIELTNKIKEACNYLQIVFLEHLIISKEDYYSFSNDGKL